MKLHHVGTVVEDIAACGAAYRECLGLQPASGVIHDPVQKVHVQFWRDAAGNLLELIQPAAADSPVAQALRKGGGLNHLCYEVRDIDAEVQNSLSRGALPVCNAVPAAAFDGRRVAFVYFRELQLIEFVEAPQ